MIIDGDVEANKEYTEKKTETRKENKRREDEKEIERKATDRAKKAAVAQDIAANARGNAALTLRPAPLNSGTVAAEPSSQITTDYTAYAGAELIGVGAMIASGGGAAFAEVVTTLSAGAIIKGTLVAAGPVIVGVGMVAIGIDICEGNGIDKTLDFLDRTIGKPVNINSSGGFGSSVGRVYLME